MLSFENSQNIGTLVSEINQNPANADLLLKLSSTSSDYFPCKLAVSSIISTPAGIQNLLSLAANNESECHVRVCILETLIANEYISRIAHQEGAGQVALNIMKAESTPPEVIMAARHLFSSDCFDVDASVRMRLLMKEVELLKS